MTTPVSAPDAARILAVDDDPIILHLVQALLTQAGHQVRTAATGEAGLTELQATPPDLVLLDVQLPDRSGEEMLLAIRSAMPEVPVIMLSAQDSVKRAVEILKLGPYDYLTKPVDPDRLALTVQRALQEKRLERRVAQLEREAREVYRFDKLVGGSPAMRQLYEQLKQVAESKISAFIAGESGTGKELVARAIHANSPRASWPFVALNCGAIAESLQESELFGHEKGAFTGAVQTHKGVFERAHKGTLFLDELGELSPGAQTRLLRVLQEQKLQRVGGTQDVSVDVRIVAATHRHLEELVKEGRFREDLYYRLVVYPLELPPLRARRDDIPLLVQHFLEKYARHASDGRRGIERDTLDVLCRHEWPGNVRELENVVQRALVAQPRGDLSLGSLPPKLVLKVMGLDSAPAPAASATVAAAAGHAPSVAERGTDGASPAAADVIVPLEVLERDAIERAIRVLGGNMSLAAQRLGIGRATLYRKLAQFGRPLPPEAAG